MELDSSLTKLAAARRVLSISREHVVYSAVLNEREKIEIGKMYPREVGESDGLNMEEPFS